MTYLEISFRRFFCRRDLRNSLHSANFLYFAHLRRLSENPQNKLSKRSIFEDLFMANILY
jgi:hypothetical protein